MSADALVLDPAWALPFTGLLRQPDIQICVQRYIKGRL